MRRYRTEIVIPPDRYIGLQLPAHLPAGRAVITVLVDEAEAERADSPDWPDADDDRQDIEWWDEFDDVEFDDSVGLSTRGWAR